MQSAFRVVIRRGEIWWANLDELGGSAPGFPSQLLTIDRDRLTEKVGPLRAKLLRAFDTGLRLALEL